MSRKYPRRYLVVEGGKFERVIVRNPVQETAIMLRHAEALGLNKYEPYDLRRDRVPDTDQAKGE